MPNKFRLKRLKADEVTFDDFTVAIERIVAEIEKKSRILSPQERRRTAFHEMGHALVASSLPGVDPVQKVSRYRRARLHHAAADRGPVSSHHR